MVSNPYHGFAWEVLFLSYFMNSFIDENMCLSEVFGRPEKVNEACFVWGIIPSTIGSFKVDVWLINGNPIGDEVS